MLGFTERGLGMTPGARRWNDYRTERQRDRETGRRRDREREREGERERPIDRLTD